MQKRIDVLEYRDYRLAARNENKEVENFDIKINNASGQIPEGFSESASKVKDGYVFAHNIADDFYYVSENEVDIIKELPKERVLTQKEKQAEEHKVRIEKAKKSAVIHAEQSKQNKIKEYKELEKFLNDKDIKIGDFPAMDVYVTTPNLPISQVKSKYENFEKTFNKKPLLPKRIIKSDDMLKVIKQQSENALKILEERRFIEDFGFTVEFDLNEEKDEVKVQIKDKSGNIVSSLVSNEVFHEDKEVEFTFEVEGFDRRLGEVSTEVDSSMDVEYMNLDIDVESDSETKNLVIFEDGKELKDASESEYYKIYELFNNYSVAKFDLDNITYTGLDKYNDEFECNASTTFSDAKFSESSIGTDFADIDLTDKSDVMRWIRETVSENSYDEKLISEVSEKMKSKSSTIGIKRK